MESPTGNRRPVVSCSASYAHARAAHFFPVGMAARFRRYEIEDLAASRVAVAPRDLRVHLHRVASEIGLARAQRAHVRVVPSAGHRHRIELEYGGRARVDE